MSHGIQRQSGTKRHDWLVGDDDNNTLAGLGGNDKIFGFEGDDTLDGGTGNDTLNGGVGNDILIGGSGRDRLTDENGDGTLDGGAGSDFVEIANGRHTVFGGAGNDLIFLTEWSGNQDVTIDGGSGTDMLQLFAWSDGPGDIDWSKVSNVEMIRVLSNEGDAFLAVSDAMFNGTDVLTIIGERGIPNSLRYDFFFDGSSVSAGALQLVGHASGSDTLSGGAKDDILIGLDGADVLRGGGGSDIIDGGEYQDVAVFSGNLADYSIEYDPARGALIVTDNVGGDGVDVLTNVEKLQFADTLHTPIYPGSTIVGTKKDDRLIGTDGGDVIEGLGGKDRLGGKSGNDYLDGGSGNDQLNGGESNDTLVGGSGNDKLRDYGGGGIADGGDGNDDILMHGGLYEIFGGAGNDKVSAGEIDGTILGGDGDDEISVSALSHLLVDAGAGDDLIQGTMITASTIIAGAGDDFVFVYFSGQPQGGIDGGDGFDRLRLHVAPYVEWQGIIGFEYIEVAGLGQRIEIELTDAMFVNQSSWIVDASKASNSRDPIGIDASAVTIGQLTMIGGDKSSDTLTGGALDDTLVGLKGDDILAGGAGDDVIDGGGGIDGATYSGKFADYTITHNDQTDRYTIIDNVGTDGTDMIKDIEKLRFSDQVHWF